MIKYEVVFSKRFKKSFKKCVKKGKNIDKLFEVIDILANNKELDKKYRDHELSNYKDFNKCRDLHIEPDWILLYRYNDDELELLLINTGSHSDLFK